MFRMGDAPYSTVPGRMLLALAFGAVWGCNCDDELGALKATIEVPPKIDFGQVAINSTKDVTFNIKNLGSFLLTVDQFVADAPFIAPTVTATIGTGTQGTIEVMVGFRPTQLGPVSGVLRFSTTDPGAPTVEIALVGIGIEAAIEVDPSMVDFGEINWTTATRPVPRMITVRNPGSDSFDLTAIEVTDDVPPTGGANPVFAVNPMNAIRTFAPGDSEQFEVTFQPNARGVVTGSIRILNTTRAAPDIVVPLRATGVGPRMEICAAPMGGTELCSQNGDAPRIDFGFIEINTQTQGTIRVLNVGDRDLKISQVLATGPIDDFSFNPPIANMAELTIPPGQEMSWTVTWAPEDYEFTSIIVTFVTNTTPGGHSSVRVEGKVPKATIEVRPDGLTIRLSGNVPRSDNNPIRVFNCGQRALEFMNPVRLVAQVGGSAFRLENLPTPGTMIPPQDCINDPPGVEFNVVFEPPANGNYSAAIEIDTNDPVQPSATVTIGATKS